MFDIVRQKFLQHQDLAEKLLATGDGYLEEGNNWGDRYFGVVNGVGENVLGCSLMIVREELKKRKQGETPTEVMLLTTALIPPFPVYLDKLDGWYNIDSLVRKALLKLPYANIQDRPLGITISIPDTKSFTAREAWVLLMKCLSIGKYEIKDMDQLEEYLGTHSKSFQELLQETVGEWEVVAEKLGKAQGYLVHEDVELEEALRLDPEGYVRSWLKETLSNILHEWPEFTYDEDWERLICLMYESGTLVEDRYTAMHGMTSRREMHKSMVELCKVLQNVNIRNYVDAFINVCGFDWIQEKYINIRTKVAEALITTFVEDQVN